MSNGRARSWVLQAVLFASLAVNLFVAGFFAAHLWRHPQPQGMPGGPMAVIDRLSEPLPPKDKEALLAAWKANQAKMQSLTAEQQAARREVRAKLVADPFDQAALAAALAAARAKHAAVDEAMQGIILDAVANFSPEGRKLLWSRPPPH